MKRLAPLLALVFTLTAPAQEPGKPLLWKIAGAKPSYVFGTIHLAGPRETTLAPAVEKALDEVSAVFCEIPMDMESQMKAAMGMMSKDKPLKDALPKDLYERIETELKHINPALTLAPLQSMQVWALTVMLPLLEEQMKNPMGKPLDAQLYARAQAAGKEVGGLETPDEQLKMLGGFSADDQLALLRSTLSEMEKARREKRSPINELREAYLSGDLVKIDAKMNEMTEGLDPELTKRFLGALITERNHRMAERIAAKLKEAGGAKSFFFAIGAAHLGGEAGVVRLLQKSGVRIDRVTN